MHLLNCFFFVCVFQMRFERPKTHLHRSEFHAFVACVVFNRLDVLVWTRVVLADIDTNFMTPKRLLIV